MEGTPLPLFTNPRWAVAQNDTRQRTSGRLLLTVNITPFLNNGTSSPTDRENPNYEKVEVLMKVTSSCDMRPCRPTARSPQTLTLLFITTQSTAILANNLIFEDTGLIYCWFPSWLLYPEDEGNSLLRNVIGHLPIYKVSESTNSHFSPLLRRQQKPKLNTIIINYLTVPRPYIQWNSTSSVSSDVPKKNDG